MFELYKWLVAKFVAVTLWIFEKSLKAAKKRIERNNRVIKELSEEIVELENDNDVMKEYLGQAKIAVPE